MRVLNKGMTCRINLSCLETVPVHADSQLHRNKIDLMLLQRVYDCQQYSL